MVKLFDFKKLSPLITYTLPVITILSAIKLVLYFDRFNVDIINYINFSELLLMFMDDIAYFLCIYIPLSIIMYFLNYEGYSNNVKNHIVAKERNFKYRFRQYLKHERFNFANAGIFLVLAIIFRKYLSSFFTIIIFGPSVIGFMVFLIDEAFIKMYKDDEITNYYSERNLVLQTLMIVMFLGFLSISNYLKVKSNYYNETKIHFKEKIVTINDELKYIDKTENFLILYSVKTNSPDIYKMSAIDRIEFSCYYKEEKIIKPSKEINEFLKFEKLGMLVKPLEN